jgi:hypothetical protein
MRRGTAEEAEHLMGLFDKYRPEKALLVAPHLHDFVMCGLIRRDNRDKAKSWGRSGL